MLCGKLIKILEKGDNYPRDYMWNNGTVEKFECGYGSKHDGDVIIAALCDNCIDKLVKDKKIEIVGNFIEDCWQKLT